MTELAYIGLFVVGFFAGVVYHAVVNDWAERSIERERVKRGFPRYRRDE